jgi:hypothetical protein
MGITLLDGAGRKRYGKEPISTAGRTETPVFRQSIKWSRVKRAHSHFLLPPIRLREDRLPMIFYFWPEERWSDMKSQQTLGDRLELW